MKSIAEKIMIEDKLIELTAISPLDGRYSSKTEELAHFSEFALILNRVSVELEWLLHLSHHNVISLDTDVTNFFSEIIKNFDKHDAIRIKEIEKITNHDVKAVEYYLKERIENKVFENNYGKENINITNFIHFGCTSEDINNIAHAMMLREGRRVLEQYMSQLVNMLIGYSINYTTPMLSRTHGQPASPTTVEKEIAVFSTRLSKAYKKFMDVKIYAKINGASGNFNAHMIAFPNVDWEYISKTFITSMGFEHNSITTQIEPHDYIAEMFHALSRFNTILIDMNRDIWGYISMGYLKQKTIDGEIGSSTMPHKVNPIDFENAEGNLGLANAVLDHMANKLPISRWQRDLTDSTVLRNMGVGFGYTLIALKSTLKGLNKLEANIEVIEDDLNNNWEVLGEAIQTVMRANGIDKSYERLKELTRGKRIGGKDILEFVNKLDIPQSEKDKLIRLTPAKYIGNASTY